MRTHVLVVHDESADGSVFKNLFGDEYEVATAAGVPECLAMLETFRPDLVLLDAATPDLDGYEGCRQIKATPNGRLAQVILAFAHGTPVERRQVYEACADDFVVKPLDPNELRSKARIQLRVQKLLAEQPLTRTNATASRPDASTRSETQGAVATRDVTVFALAKLAESRDPEIGKHLERMRAYSQILAQAMADGRTHANEIDRQFLANLYLASPLHDVGKAGISDVILLKPDRLSPSEFEIMKQHTVIGADALAGAARRANANGFLAMSTQVARWHHERFNGTGYPDGLRGDEIPLAARIVALADVYDALTTERVYKPAVDSEIARCTIEQEVGSQFDPDVVAAFQNCWTDFVEARATIDRRITGDAVAAHTVSRDERLSLEGASADILS